MAKHKRHARYRSIYRSRYRSERRPKNAVNLRSPRPSVLDIFYVSKHFLHNSFQTFCNFFRDLTAKKVILSVIITTTVVVCVGILSAIFADPERRIDSSFKTLAADYYENIFYADLTASENYSGNPKAALEKYQTTGITSVTLRQLSLSDRTDKNLTDLLLEYCDADNTVVTFFPEPPYSKTSYRAEYFYSCDF